MSVGAIDRKPINKQRHTHAMGNADWPVVRVVICDFEDLNSILVSQTRERIGWESSLRLRQK